MVRVMLWNSTSSHFSRTILVRLHRGWHPSRGPFHGVRQEWRENDVKAAVAAGEFTANNRSFWVRARQDRVGLVRFRYLDEALTPTCAY
jgi:hypothetical protein